MKKIGLLSDTHSYIDARMLHHLQNCDEIWHAGDFGSAEVADRLEDIAPLRAVWGNIDGQELRQRFPETLRFTIEGLNVLMTHIGGYPGKYNPRIRPAIQQNPPQLFICGHSHILKIMPDPKHPGLLHINPGAAGKHGFHKQRTMVLFEVEAGKLQQLQVVELGHRAAINK